MTTTLTNYQQAARTLLDQGFEELAAGDTRQASEKGWGATAQMLKAVAEQRGWEHKSHAALFKVVNKTVAATGDLNIHSRFAIANALHQNFYENLAESEYVLNGLQEIRWLIDRLEVLLETE
ncbi:MAG: hypothetical protein OXG89_01165 [bacterium]|nr:hypothetical protein [bacterium]